jgi:pantoate--beta-alanine ligase
VIVVSRITDVRAQVASHRAQGKSIALVPTMGNLHEGHRTLIRKARADNDIVIVSLYVNPLQFGPGEDLATYPRTLPQDRAAMEEDQADILFMPDDATMYPRGLEQQTKVEVPGLGSMLEGASRPLFFRGVTTVVNRLFNIIQADRAYFGKKDYQQMVIIEHMVSDLAMNMKIVGLETVRDPDGLALSSRNSYLSQQQRRVAPALYQGLQSGVTRFRSGNASLEEVENGVMNDWAEAGIRPDYASIRCRHDLSVPRGPRQNLVMLGAGYAGNTRLIDNIEF